MPDNTSAAAASSDNGGGTAPDLFTPVKVGRYDLANRMVMAPMTRNRAAEGNVPQLMNAEYYAQRASAGLLITEGSQVSPQGLGYPATPGIYSPEQVAAWKRVTDPVHALGGRIFLQLWHVGRISHPSLQPGGALPVAPSAIKPAGQGMTYQGLQDFVTPRALDLDEIPDIVTQFEDGARNALEAGFDGVEIHGANGYLLDQFLRDGSNRRTDAYGGPVENRARLMLEVTEAVASVWGGDRVGMRLSPINGYNDITDGNPAATFEYAARELGRFGLAYLHVIEPDLTGATPALAYDRLALRQAFGGPYIANGGYDRVRAGEEIAAGRVDLVSFGAPYLANPDLVERFRRGAELNAPDRETFYGGDERGYIDYPVLAQVPGQALGGAQTGAAA
jgi:N-ethylmaleimide reductase